ELKPRGPNGEGGTWDKNMSLDQPFCTYLPRVQVLFPAYYNGEKEERTGQTFTVKNSAAFDHNTNWKGGRKNPGDNPLLRAGKKVNLTINPDDRPLLFTCVIHTWMKAYAWAFDHPYAAVTDKDGKFKIENAPAGADVEVWYWHETMTAPKKLKVVKLKAENNEENFKIGAK